MLFSVGRPVTVTWEVTSNESPISSSLGLVSTNETFSIAGRPLYFQFLHLALVAVDRRTQRLPEALGLLLYTGLLQRTIEN